MGHFCKGVASCLTEGDSIFFDVATVYDFVSVIDVVDIQFFLWEDLTTSFTPETISSEDCVTEICSYLLLFITQGSSVRSKKTTSPRAR